MDSQINSKIKIISFICMITLLFVHNYNISGSYQTPSSLANTSLNIISFTEYFLSNSLLRFRIPLLMAISGFLMAKSYKHSYTLFISKKINTLLIPFAIISTIGFLTCVFFQIINTQLDASSKGIFEKSISEMGIKDFVYHTILAPTSFQLWYLKIMFLLAMCLPIIRFVLHKLPIATLVTIATIWLFTNYLGGETKDRGYIFFLLGFYFAESNKDVSKPFSFIGLKHASILLILIATFRTYLAFLPAHNNAMHFTMIFTFKIIGILGCYVCWFGVDYLVATFNKSTFLKNISKSSFFIFAFHAPLLTLTNFLLKKYVLQTNEEFFIAYFLLPICVATVMIVIDFLVRKNFTQAYSIITGGRNVALKHNNVNYFAFLDVFEPQKIYQSIFNYKLKQQWQHIQYYTLIIGVVLYKIFH